MIKTMNKNVFIAIATIIILAIAYYLISPLWRVKVADDVSPLASPIAQTQPFQPRTIAQGTLIPKEHEVEGTVLLIEQNGKKILRFENLNTINGPDLKIYMSRDYTNKDYVSLGDIKATKGNVNYDLPSTINTDTYNHILIWCEQFRVLFSGAELK